MQSNIKKLLDQQQFIFAWLEEQPGKIAKRQIPHQKAEPSLRRVHDELSRYWEEFVKADEILSQELGQEHDYIRNLVFNTAKNMHDQFLEDLEKMRAAESETSEPQYGASSINTQKKKVLTKKASVSQKDSDGERSDGNAEVMRMLTNLMGEFKEMKSKINEMEKEDRIPTREQTAPREPSVVRVPETGPEEIARLKSELEKEKTRMQRQVAPELKKKLPIFNGDIATYSAWKHLFTSIVDEYSNSPSEKLQFLMQSLMKKTEKEDYGPFGQVELLMINDANYKVALDKLDEKYFNPAKIAASLIDKVLNLKRPYNVSGDQHFAVLDRTFDTTEINIKSIVKAAYFPDMTQEEEDSEYGAMQIDAKAFQVWMGRILLRNFDDGQKEQYASDNAKH